MSKLVYFTGDIALADNLGIEECMAIQELLKKLHDYEVAEEEGLLLKSPFPLGTEKLYMIWDYEIYELKAKEITFCKADIMAIRPHETVITVDCNDFYYDDFGKTVFLTKEEAEQKLAEMRGEL